MQSNQFQINRIFVSLLFIHIVFIIPAKSQLAKSYPNDVGIELDASVLYVETFEDGMTSILSRYSDVKNKEGMSLDSDVPTESVGQNSIKMTSVQGENSGGHLFKRFTPGFDSTVYIRYYVKYPLLSNGYFHHESVWFGGYNPATSWPDPRAGSCGLESSRLSISYEPVWQNDNPPGMDTYIYWGEMHSFNDGGTCYGNVMITQGREGFGSPASPTAPAVNFDEWMCVELMIKLNTPVSANNGELAIWQDGILTGHWGPGFPNGHWGKDKWYNNPDDPPFQGFQWRTDASLNINWLWLEFYHDHPDAPSSYIKFDHLVMAEKYIGPIYNPTGLNDNPDTSAAIRIFPNPTSGTLSITGLSKNSELTVFNILGEKVLLQKPDNTFLTIDLNSSLKGVYFVKIDDDSEVFMKKIILQ